MINLRFVNVVWGEAYTDTFINVCLPNSLSAGNLPFVAAHSRSSYCLYTTPKDAEKIERSPAGRRLAELMNFEILRVDAAFPIEDPTTNQICPQKYGAMSLCHTHFIKRHGNDGTGMVFLSPDLVFADGSLRRLLEIAQSGKRLVMMCALRLAKESFIADLQRHHTRRGVLQSIGKRELVGLAMKHLHPETESLIWDSAEANAWPSLLLWRAKQEGLVLRAFHLHPLMVRPARNDVVPVGTLDDDYVGRACPDPADEYIVGDSDELVGFELSRRAARADSILQRTSDVAHVAQWARTHANPKHQKFVRHKIRLHATELSETWEATEERSDRVIQEIQSLLAPETCAVSP